MLRIPFLRKYAIRLYAKQLATIFADSINKAREIRDWEIAKKFPIFLAPMYILALLPAIAIYEHVSLITGDRHWIDKIQSTRREA